MSLDYAKHKSTLLQILKDIYTDPTIAPYLGFKGGTAAMLFYGLERNSVDLDFDLIDAEKADMVFEKVRTIITAYGEEKEAEVKKHTILFSVAPAQNAHQIKVEINTRKFNSHYEVVTLLGISMQVMVKEDMFAHKIMALYERQGYASRDIFDVYTFFKNGWSYNSDIIKDRSGKSVAAVFAECIRCIEKLDEKKLLDGLGGLLSDEKRLWAKTKMKEDTLFFLRLALANEESAGASVGS
jgi:predicted nucleotidyltransferase component of viral defense system